MHVPVHVVYVILLLMSKHKMTIQMHNIPKAADFVFALADAVVF
jgi:hypothetical protein